MTKNIPAQENSKARPAKTGARRPKIPKKITETYLHNAGLYYLQRFSASTARFRLVMMRKIEASCRHHAGLDKTHCITLLNELIEKLTRLGLLNDQNYAASLVSTLRRRGLSRRAIESRLAAKGISQEDSAALFKSSPNDRHGDGQSGIRDAEKIAALRLARKRRLGPFHPDPASENRKKSLSIFGRAGFEYETADFVLNMDVAEAQSLFETKSLFW